MSNLIFHKYQATGNDFIMIDDREDAFDINNLELVRSLCERKFGIGADGLILIRNHPDSDFEMIYFNSDGSQSLCGNGSRAAISFAHSLGMIGAKTRFMAIDGYHEGSIENDLISVKMHDVSQGSILDYGEDVFLSTGSPHYIRLVEDLNGVEIVPEARSIRYNDPFVSQGGTNVNFVQLRDNQVHMRTYERGVEDETLSCGTGVTAVSLAVREYGFSSPVEVHTQGGILQVSYSYDPNFGFTDIFLVGPAKKSFTGEIMI